VSGKADETGETESGYMANPDFKLALIYLVRKIESFSPTDAVANVRVSEEFKAAKAAIN
jgi:hypothetical protein